MVVLVLIAMQKLASSSVAAIRRSLKNRLKRIADARQHLEQLSKERDQAKKRLVTEYEGLEEVSLQMPRVDLNELLPFLRATLTFNGRILREEDGELTFRTPEAWAKEIGVRASYDGLTFDRHYRGSDANQRILGVGHPVINLALRWAERRESQVATIPKSVLRHPLLVGPTGARGCFTVDLSPGPIHGLRPVEDDAGNPVVAVLQVHELNPVIHDAEVGAVLGLLFALVVGVSRHCPHPHVRPRHHHRRHP